MGEQGEHGGTRALGICGEFKLWALGSSGRGLGQRAVYSTWKQIYFVNHTAYIESHCKTRKDVLRRPAMYPKILFIVVAARADVNYECARDFKLSTLRRYRKVRPRSQSLAFAIDSAKSSTALTYRQFLQARLPESTPPDDPPLFVR